MSGKLLNSISNINEKRSDIRSIPNGYPDTELIYGSIPNIKPDTRYRIYCLRYLVGRIPDLRPEISGRMNVRQATEFDIEYK